MEALDNTYTCRTDGYIGRNRFAEESQRTCSEFDYANGSANKSSMTISSNTWALSSQRTA